MRYIKLENNKPKNYSIEQLFIDIPDAIIYKNTQMPNEKLLANYDVYPLITTVFPDIKEDEIAEESTPEFRNGEWKQTWIVRKLTKEEIENRIANNSYNVIINENMITETQKSFLANKDIQESRYETCKTCEHFTALKTCSQCGCIMPLKVILFNATCPLDKW